MRFPTVFKRRKGGVTSEALLGSDAVPTTVPAAFNTDNVVFCALRDLNGWPCQRIAFCWTTTAGAPTVMNFDAYFWEDATQHWYKINDAVIAAKVNQLYFFDTATILEQRATGAMLGNPGSPAQAGGMAVLLVMTDPGAQVNGVFTVAAGPDLTTVGT
jgi:hypothetical protein